jgi:hypothetical protein
MEKTKIMICPACQSDKVRKYVYGHHLVAYGGEYIMRDHIVAEGSPRFHCDYCGMDYGEAEGSD